MSEAESVEKVVPRSEEEAQINSATSTKLPNINTAEKSYREIDKEIRTAFLESRRELNRLKERSSVFVTFSLFSFTLCAVCLVQTTLTFIAIKVFQKQLNDIIAAATGGNAG